MNRVNPLLVRTPMELIGGVDQQGNKVSDTQKAIDTIKQVIPIPAQAIGTATGILPNQQLASCGCRTPACRLCSGHGSRIRDDTAR